MQFDLIKEVLTGSITGYITNAIAIKMIFREYGIGKLKVGGVVVKTRKEFIHNVSSLVEREIINPQTLSNELSKESFRDSIGKFAEDLLNVHIYKNTSDKYFGELKGFNSTVNKTGEYIKGVVNNNISTIVDTLSKNIYLQDLISEKQAQHISGQLFNSVLNLSNNKGFIEKTIEDFYNENKSLSFGEFFGNKLVEAIGKNFEEESKNFHIDLKNNFDGDIDKVFANTFKVLEVDKILNGLEEEVLEKRIIDFISTEHSMNLWENLKGKVKEFLKSDEGKILINSLSEELLTILKSIDKPILSLFSSSLKGNVEGFFKDKLQHVVKELILWIEKNKTDIEGLVEDAIEDTIHSIDDEFKRNTLKTLKDKFLNGAAEKFEIVSKITEYLDNSADIDSISKDITVIIIDSLKKEKVSSVVQILQNNNIVSRESVTDYITDNIIKFTDNLTDDYINQLLDKKIKDIVNINLAELFQSYVKEPLISVIKDEFIYTESITKLVTGELNKNLRSINTLRFEELITEEALSLGSNRIKKIMVDELNNNENNIKALFQEELNRTINSVTLYKALNDNLRESLLDKFKRITFSKTDKFFKECKDLEIKEIYEKINNIDNFNGIITDSTQQLLKDNLDYILNGNIKKAVSSNLRNLKDEELQEMVETFMGTEMKPITVIGALLGAVAGIGMYFFNRSNVQYNFITATIISVLVYGVVGWLTNVQAIAMLFRPYTEKRFLGIRIPFTPGVIVNRKSKFAKSMSSFVDEELLKKSSIEQLFNKNRTHIYNKLCNVVSKDEYKIARDFLYKHSDTISEKTYKYSKNSILTNKDKISKSLVDELSSYDFYNVDFSEIKDKAEKEILVKIKSADIKIGNKVHKLLKSNNMVSDLIPKHYLSVVEKKLSNKTTDVIDSFNINDQDKRNKLLSIFSNKYDKLVNKPVNEVIRPSELTKCKESLNKLIISTATSENTRDKAFDWLEALIEKELTPDKKLDQLLGGFFIKVIKDNFIYITDNTIKSIVKGVSNNQQAIAEVAITTTKEGLGFFEIMGYNMLGGDQIISDIVHNLVNYKFPDFIEAKKEELHELLEDFVQNEICGSKIEALGIRLERNEILDLIDKFIKDEENTKVLGNNIIKITDSIFHQITNFETEEYLKSLSINKFEDIINIFKDELNFVEKKLTSSVNTKKEALAVEYADSINRIFKDLVLSKKVNALTEGLDEEYITSMSKNLSDVLYNSNSIKKNLSDFIQNLIDEELKKKSIDQLFDLNELNNSIVVILNKVIENTDIDNEVRETIDYAVKDIIANNLSILDSSTKEAAANIVITSIVDSLGENFSSMLHNIDFRSITESEINDMEPKEIEDLFNSFAKKYFDRLKLYGFGGAAFGLHWAIGVITAVLYAGSEVKNKTKD